MLAVRKSNERGKGEFGWLSARYSFSFANYYSPHHNGFRDLLVINQDTVEAGRGFGEHPHRDMEILTYIIDGAIEHKDSMGNHGIIRKGEIQRMSAGTGVRHSEFNPNPNRETQLLQIWIQPNQLGLPPSYEQISYAEKQKESSLVLLASPNAENNSLKVHQDIRLYAGKLQTGESTIIQIASNRHAWIQVIHGQLTVNQTAIEAGDGVAISQEEKIQIQANVEAEFLVFDLN